MIRRIINNTRLKAVRWLAAALTTAVTASCGGNGSISEFTHIRPEGWAYGDTVKFDIDSAMRVGQPLVIALRHNDSYPYRNIYIEIAVEGDEGVRRDTVGIELCDIYGHWYGHGIGASMQIERPAGLSTGKSDRRINLRHVMRVDTLKGIELIGISGQPTDK